MALEDMKNEDYEEENIIELEDDEETLQGCCVEHVHDEGGVQGRMRRYLRIPCGPTQYIQSLLKMRTYGQEGSECPYTRMPPLQSKIG